MKAEGLDEMAQNESRTLEESQGENLGNTNKIKVFFKLMSFIWNSIPQVAIHD